MNSREVLLVNHKFFATFVVSKIKFNNWFKDLKGKNVLFSAKFRKKLGHSLTDSHRLEDSV